MTTITREQALKIIEAADEVISALAGTNEDVHPGSDNMLRLWDDLNDRYAPPEVVRELARIALASLEAEPVSQTYKLTFEQWLEQQHDKIDVDCGCVSTEMFMHWIRVAYEAGNSPVTPDGWISCSERMPPQDDWILIYSKHGEYMAGQVQGEYVELSDGTLSWLGNVLFWMPLPEPPQEAK
ncbi:DUF551 domain-containing protein [Escherichia coli]|uniref:DUF551 domain-containing protein n=1 Tax=Escherichia coli TaxID=562 RepID=UPI00178D0713|nr:DUF551 domain-containing protein [Escherichia coli]MBE1721174.1 DUF551 domain-containing protein [Escherichia coli]MDL7166368.1 DUF551 domain-containing protein [Escherichia coli]